MADHDSSLDTLIINTSNTMIIVTDREGRIVRFNEFGARLLGYEVSDLRDQIVWQILPPPEFRERARQRHLSMVGGESLEMETVWLTRSGERKWFSCTAKGVLGPDGKITYTICTGVDISARVAAETALRESEEHFRTTFNDAAIGMALVDQTGHYIRMNRTFCELTGYDESELRNFDLLVITHPDDRQLNSDLFKRLVGGEIPGYVLEKRYIRRNGETIWVQVSASLAGGGLGRPATVIGLFENISERHAAREAMKGVNSELLALNETLEQRMVRRTDELARSKQELIEQSQVLRSIVDSMGDAVYVADEAGKLVLTNPAAERISGPIRQGIDMVVGRANQPWFFQADGKTRLMPQDLPLMRSARGELVDDQELMIQRPGSPEIWVRTTARPLRDETGKHIGAVAVARDVTERRRHEAELQQANASLEQANRLLRDSEQHYRDLADSNLRLAREVEHRVRNNLQGLLGLLSVMRDRSTDVRSFADALESRLSAMRHVHQLLADTQWTPVGIRSLIDGTLATLAHTAPCLPIEMHVEGPDVMINPRQVLPLTLVLVEWFTNSCKYGAHSIAGGRLRIVWQNLPDSIPPRIRLTWTERGGPPIKTPGIPSLGTELVQAFARRELAGSVELRYPPEGADHVLEFTLREEAAMGGKSEIRNSKFETNSKAETGENSINENG